MTADRDMPSTGGSATPKAGAAEFRRTHQVHLDLRTPPPAALFGIAPPAQSISIDRGTGPVFDVDLQLPAQAHLRTAAVEVDAAYDGSLPSVFVAATYPDIATARRELVPTLTGLGLPVGDVDKLDRLHANTLDHMGVVDTQRGYLAIFGEVRLNGSNPRVDVSYTLSWARSGVR